MNFLIKLLFIIILFFNNIVKAETVNNKILFKINNEVFTDIDLEKRLIYISITNNLDIEKIKKKELEEIFDDYLSTLIFSEYYYKENITFNKLNEEIESLYNKNILNKIINLNLSNKEIENLQSNLRKDVIRRKIIEGFLNLEKDILQKKTNLLDLIYNYNLSYLTFKEKNTNIKSYSNIRNREDFNKLKESLLNEDINFLYKKDDINESSIISDLIKKNIKNNQRIFLQNINGYITIYSLEKNLESYEGIYVKLINFNTTLKLNENDMKCNNVKNLKDIKKTIYKEYEYKKLNQEIKKNLKSANDYIIYKDNNNFNYIMLCELRYDEELLNTINFNKKIDWLANKIQINFLNKYKNDYSYQKIK